MKYRSDIIQIFDEIITIYTEKTDIDEKDRKFILQNLEGRKAEL